MPRPLPPRRCRARPGVAPHALRRLAAAAALGSISLLCASVAHAEAQATGAAGRVTAPALAGPVVAARAEFVVMLNPGAEIAPVAAARGGQVLDRFGNRPIWRLRVPAGATLAGTLAAWQADPRVRFAEALPEGGLPVARDLVVWAVDLVVWAVGQGEQQAAAQWAPQALALPQAQGLARGEGVRVAVFDTGIDLAHPLIAPRLARNPAGRLVGIDLVDGDNDPGDTGQPGDRGYGHGTHVAGIVAQAAPGAQIIPVRVLDRNGRGNGWVLAEALLWALDPDGNPATADGARVLNFSLSTPQPTRLLRAAIALASCDGDDDDQGDIDLDAPGFEADKARCDANGGAVVLAAAGNDGNTTPQYPAAEQAEGKLAVTAVGARGQLPAFANRGPWVELAAPGDRIVSAWPGGRYSTVSGSSMATPWAAGIAALVIKLNPDWKPVDVSKRLAERSLPVCGQAELRRLHAHGAVADFVPEGGC
jgi:subtilisin family serine protease